MGEGAQGEAMSKTGTREWSGSSLNIQVGCSHGCLYCYGREAALRFGRIPNGAAWACPTLDWTAINKGYRLRKRQPIMVPTTHDITMHNWVYAVEMLRKVLAAGNQVLLVSKPDVGVWRSVREALADYKGQIELRFTIGALTDEVARYWEPGAPSIRERLEALQEAHRDGWQTSVSCEPLLEPDHAMTLVSTVERFCTGTVWIGAMRHPRRRTAWYRKELERRLRLVEGTLPLLHAAEADLAILEAKIQFLEAWQRPDAPPGEPSMRRVYEALRGMSKVRWKDSFWKALGLKGPEEDGQ
jgi:DNA repair photolyase